MNIKMTHKKEDINKFSLKNLGENETNKSALHFIWIQEVI